MSDPVFVAPDDTIASVIAEMQRQRLGCVIVGDGDRVRGLFTERDVLKRVLADGVSPAAPIGSVMTPDPDMLSLSDSIALVIRRMHEGGFRHMPVLDDGGRIVGVVSVKRVVTYLVEHFPEVVYNLPPDSAGVVTSREGG